MKEAVLYNKKKITIREGHRDYIPGPVILCCHLLGWATMREITKVQHKTLADIMQLEWEADGFSSQLDMEARLREFYPNIHFNSQVTVIEWE